MLRSMIATALLLGAMASPAIAADPAPVTSGSGRSYHPTDCGIYVLPTTPQANLGECVSYDNSSDMGFASHYCDAFLEIQPDLFYTVYDSRSQCVRENKGTF